MAEAQDYTYVGTRPIRPDGIEKVTGKANYGADESRPGLIHGVVVRSTHAHALIEDIDVSAALALDGVYAVVTAADFPARDKISPARKRMFENIIAGRKVVYHGQPLAAVAASSVALAQKAAELVKVTYKALPVVLDMREAMAPDATVLHDDMFTQGLPETPDKPSNLVQKTAIRKGDIEAGFAEADIIIEREFVTPMVHQGYIEPHACTADVNTDGHTTLWCSSQGHFGIRDMAALSLGMDAGDIRVIPRKLVVVLVAKPLSIWNLWPSNCLPKQDGRLKWSCRVMKYSEQQDLPRVPLTRSRSAPKKTALLLRLTPTCSTRRVPSQVALWVPALCAFLHLMIFQTY